MFTICSGSLRICGPLKLYRRKRERERERDELCVAVGSCQQEEKKKRNKTKKEEREETFFFFFLLFFFLLHLSHSKLDVCVFARSSVQCMKKVVGRFVELSAVLQRIKIKILWKTWLMTFSRLAKVGLIRAKYCLKRWKLTFARRCFLSLK